MTGAGQGNGRAIALALRRRGARVIVTDVDATSAEVTARSDPLGRRGGERSCTRRDRRSGVHGARAAHGTRDRSVDRRGEQCRDHHPGNHRQPATPHENWRKVAGRQRQRHLQRGPRLAAGATQDHAGPIINVASIASFVGQCGDTLGYSPSKGAVKLFTQSLARDLAPDGIRVNAMAPGVIETPMTEEHARGSRRGSPAFMARTPLGRVGQPEELVGPVIFLASPMASYVNGAILPVDGGFLAV